MLIKYVKTPNAQLQYGSHSLEKRYAVKFDSTLIGWVGYCPQTKEWVAFDTPVRYLPQKCRSRREAVQQLCKKQLGPRHYARLIQEALQA